MNPSKEDVLTSFNKDGRKYLVRKAEFVGEEGVTSCTRGMTLREAQREAADKARANPGSSYCVFMAVDIAVAVPSPNVMFESIQ